MSISRSFNVSDIYPLYDDQPLYSGLRGDLRSSLSQVKGTNMEHVTTIFIDQINKAKLQNKSVKKPKSI
jgi:hypothetical protein